MGYFGDQPNGGVDFHEYHAFGDWNLVVEQPDAWETNLQVSCDYAPNMQSQTLVSFVGEWSLAVQDCQKYLDGGYMTPYVPAASEATCEYYNSDFSTFTDEYKEFLRNFMLAQVQKFVHLS